jgi:hypothetical protein
MAWLQGELILFDAFSAKSMSAIELTQVFYWELIFLLRVWGWRFWGRLRWSEFGTSSFSLKLWLFDRVSAVVCFGRRSLCAGFLLPVRGRTCSWVLIPNVSSLFGDSLGFSSYSAEAAGSILITPSSIYLFLATVCWNCSFDFTCLVWYVRMRYAFIAFDFPIVTDCFQSWFGALFSKAPLCLIKGIEGSAG